MYTYKLTVLYPSSNERQFSQSAEIALLADKLDYTSEMYIFKVDNIPIAYYPIRYTIISSIE